MRIVASPRKSSAESRALNPAKSIAATDEKASERASGRPRKPPLTSLYAYKHWADPNRICARTWFDVTKHSQSDDQFPISLLCTTSELGADLVGREDGVEQGAECLAGVRAREARSDGEGDLTWRTHRVVYHSLTRQLWTRTRPDVAEGHVQLIVDALDFPGLARARESALVPVVAQLVLLRVAPDVERRRAVVDEGPALHNSVCAIAQVCVF